MNVYIKKHFSIFLILIFILSLSLIFVACEKNEGEKTITLVIGEGDTQKVFKDYKTNSSFLIGVLDELKESKEITYTATESIYGAYLTEINGIVAVGDNFICILTTVAQYQDSTDWKIEKSFEDKTYVSAILGVSDLSLVDGAGYMIVLV